MGIIRGSPGEIHAPVLNYSFSFISIAAGFDPNQGMGEKIMECILSVVLYGYISPNLRILHAYR